MASARQAAAAALGKINVDNGYSNLVLDAVLQQAKLPERDAKLCARLVYGVLERKLTLDYYIECLADRPIGQITPYVGDCLRMGLYQLLYMDKIPPHAAISETVQVVKHSHARGAAGFVNALLRAAQRSLPPLPDDRSIRYACPAWIIEQMSSDYGRAQTDAFLEDALQPPPVYLRVNTCATSDGALCEALAKAGITAQAGPVAHTLLVDAPGPLAQTEPYQRGLFHVQDLASQILVEAIALRPGERVLDLCAAPGGKSFTMAQYMRNEGEILACDLHAARTGLIEQGAKRLGLQNVKTKTMDGTVYDPALGVFDAVLCDAPCSGWGVMRRKPDVKYKSAQSIGALPDVQFRLLATAARYVRPNGRLFYSTCTLRQAENEAVAERFLAQNPSFCAAVQRTLWPQTDGADGFFFASFQRGGD